MKNRIAEIIDASGKTQRSIAKAIGVHENTFYRYYSGERDMTLPLAQKMMEFLGMNPCLLHDTSPVRPILTGIDIIDKMLLDITDAVMNEDCAKGVDSAAHYFSDTFLCASPEYTYGGEPTDRIGASAHTYDENHTYPFSQMKIDKNIQMRGVTRSQEFASWTKRRSANHVASFHYLFAHLVDAKTICFRLQSSWSIVDKLATPNTAAWKNIRETYSSVDHIILRNSISQVLYEGADLLIDRKIWYPDNNAIRERSQFTTSQTHT